LTLHDLEVTGCSFCKLMMKETVDGERAMAARFGRLLVTARAASSEAPIPWLGLAVVVQAKAPPPSNELAREAPAQWHNGGGLVGNGG
jgi:hypothetical protein